MTAGAFFAKSGGEGCCKFGRARIESEHDRCGRFAPDAGSIRSSRLRQCGWLLARNARYCARFLLYAIIIAVAPSCRARGLKLVSKSLRHSHADGRTLMKGAGIEIGFGPLRSAPSALRVQQKRGFGSLDRLGRRVFEVGCRVSGARSSVIWGFAAVPSRVRGLLVPKPRFCCTSPCENVRRGIFQAAVGAGWARNGSHDNRKAASTCFDAPYRLMRSYDPR